MAVKQKLRSRRGATIMAALLFFLVAAVCGSIILAAATATASRITTQAEDARAYYSLTSAAQLVRDDLLNSRWKVEVTQTKPSGTIVKSYAKAVPLDQDGNEDTTSFIRDLLSTVGGSDGTSLFKTSPTITISTSGGGDTLPTIYAKPDNITFGTLYGDYQTGDNTELKILMTNDPEGFNNGSPTYRSNYKEGSKTRQVYWLELTLYSVKVPDGYVDKTDAEDVGKIEFQVGWDNVSIRKLVN